jgi:hypothetical protein
MTLSQARGPKGKRRRAMKVRVEVDCTPQEARAFLGQPDVEAFNVWMVEQMKARLEQNLEMLKPEELMKSWMAFGGQAQEQFRRFLEAASGGGIASKP